MEGEERAVFQRLAHRPKRENVSEALSNDSCTNMLNQYTDFRVHALREELGKTANMWIQYLGFMWMVIKETGENLCSALPALHAFRGCDSSSAFVRKGKKTVLKATRQHPQYLEAILPLEKSITIDEYTSQRLEEFCCLLYGGSAPFDVNIPRHEKCLQQFSSKPGTLLSTYNGG